MIFLQPSSLSSYLCTGFAFYIFFLTTQWGFTSSRCLLCHVTAVFLLWNPSISLSIQIPNSPSLGRFYQSLGKFWRTVSFEFSFILFRGKDVFKETVSWHLCFWYLQFNDAPLILGRDFNYVWISDLSPSQGSLESLRKIYNFVCGSPRNFCYLLQGSWRHTNVVVERSQRKVNNYLLFPENVKNLLIHLREVFTLSAAFLGEPPTKKHEN